MQSAQLSLLDTLVSKQPWTGHLSVVVKELPVAHELPVGDPCDRRHGLSQVNRNRWTGTAPIHLMENCFLEGFQSYSILGLFDKSIPFSPSLNTIERTYRKKLFSLYQSEDSVRCNKMDGRLRISLFLNLGDGQRAVHFNNIYFKCFGTSVIFFSVFFGSTVKKKHSSSIQWSIPVEEGSHYLTMILFATQMTKGTCGICERLEVQALKTFQSLPLSFENAQGQWHPWGRHSKRTSEMFCDC